MRGYDEGGGAGDGEGDDDDSPEATTEEPFAKKCIVDNKAYSHSQMIPSKDQSSHCLCVAGEVYCWWQTYSAPSSTRTPYESVGAVVVAANEVVDTWTTEEDDYSGVVGAGGVAEGHSESPEASGDFEAEASGQQQDDNVGNSSDELSDELEEDDEDIEDEDDEEEDSNDLPEAPLVAFATNSTTTTTTTTTKASVVSTARTTTGKSTTMTPHSTRAPATCLVMGRKYQEGEVLPHSTGNCVECSCGAEGRIECSPRDCVGLRPQSPWW